MILRLAIIGFGNVGQEFARLLVRKRDWLVKDKGLDIEVLAISTRSKGALLADRGLDLVRIEELIKRDGDLRGYGKEVTDLNPLEMIDNCQADVVVELTTLNIDSGQPAIDHISNALQSKMHVITANKGPIAFAYDRLESLAKSRNVKLRFEGTVMDGTPIFNLVEKTLQGCEILRREGVLNSTSNYVLTEMARGRGMDDAVKEAQRRGIAEADPTLDLEGWDAAAKIAALANVLMGAGITPQQVRRTGMSELSGEYLASAAASGKKVRLISKAVRDGSEVVAGVEPTQVDKESPFWSVDGTSSALTISTDLMGDLTVLETNPAVTQTAYAVFSDLLALAEWMRCNPD
ncbi:TPA: homoserine dehydrogenase [Thermoplasmata archaeon]|nr:homoserine dehydrogenase [Thermoplasmata archaeon]